jgi:hypothetical protein
MWQNFIGQHVRRTNRNLLVVNLVILLALASLLAVSWGYLKTFFGTPPTLTAQQIATNLPRFSGTIVTVNGDRSFSTGLQWTKGSQVLYEYAVLDTGDAFVVVKVSPGISGPRSFTGTVEDIPAEVRRRLLEDYHKEQPGAPDPFPPFLINAHDATREGWVGLVVGIPLALLAFWNLWKWRERASDITAHPAVRALKVAGQPWQAAQQIEGELPAAQEFNKLKVTASWVLAPTFFALHVRRLQDLVWVYGKVVRHYTYFIPTEKSWGIVICDANGAFEVPLKSEEMMGEAVAAIVQRVPYVIAGHTPELEGLYNGKRAEFIAAVQQRKTQAKGAAAST